MEYFYFLIALFPIFVLISFIRFKLSRWEEIVSHFESEKRPNLNPVYGYWSEFRRSPRCYPISNIYLKVAITSFGLYLQYDLKYEPIKFYKPVMIPWSNIKVMHTVECSKKGFDEYIILKGGENLGKIFLQVAISDQIHDRAKDLGIKINFA